MNHLTKITGIGLLLAGVASSMASDTNSYSASPNVVVPDGGPVGISLSIDTGLQGKVITGLTVNLNITGGWNGDLYAYLVGPSSGYAILLNRPGVGNGDSFGYGDAGFNITLDDDAAYNIHYYQDIDNPNGGQLTGSWQPDGEAVDPESGDVGNSDSTAMLASFMGGDPGGTWTLFVADLSGGAQSTVVSWGMTIVTVPEPQMYAFAGMGLLGLFAITKWKRK